MTHPTEPQDHDLDEDLFDFAAVVHAPDAEEAEEDLDEIFASFRDVAPADELLAVPIAGASHAAALPAPVAFHPPAHATHPTHAIPRGSAELPRAPGPAPRARTEAEVEPAPRAPEQPLSARARPARFSKGVVAIGLSVTLLNTLLAVVVLRGPASAPLEPAPARLADERSSEAHAAPARKPAATLPDPDALDVAHAHPTLDEARAEIARGEYSSARQRVYALLAIIDRLEDPRRGALEADCQFLIAQSLHLEALARMGESR